MEKTQEQLLEDLSGLTIRRTGLMTRFVPKSEAYIVSKAKELSADDQKMLVEGRLKTVDAVLYIAQNVTGANGVIKLIDNQDKKVGVLNTQDNGKIPAGENYSFDQIYLAFAQDASKENPNEVTYTADTSVAALRNAELEFWADNRLLCRLPVDAFHRKPTSSNQISLELEKPILIHSGERLDIRLETPGIAVPNNRKYFIKVMLRGVKTTRRG